jgi:hypothetical protein
MPDIDWACFLEALQDDRFKENTVFSKENFWKEM